jgi:hypothetical protein
MSFSPRKRKPPRHNHHPQKPLKGKFQLLPFVQSSLILIKGLSFDQSLRESSKKPRKTL